MFGRQFWAFSRVMLALLLVVSLPGLEYSVVGLSKYSNEPLRPLS